MKFNTNVFFFAALMVVSFAVRAEDAAPKPAAGLLGQASAVVASIANGTVDLAKAGWNGALNVGQQGIDLTVSVANGTVGYAQDAAIGAGKGVSSVGAWIQEHPGYTATAATIVVAGIAYYLYTAEDCKDCKKANKTK